MNNGYSIYFSGWLAGYFGANGSDNPYIGTLMQDVWDDGWESGFYDYMKGFIF